MILVPMQSEYPNIQRMLDALSDSEKSLGLMFLAMLPGETIQAIENAMPDIIDAHDTNNVDAIAAILQGFGMDTDSIGMVLETRESALNGVHD